MRVLRAWIFLDLYIYKYILDSYVQFDGSDFRNRFDIACNIESTKQYTITLNRERETLRISRHQFKQRSTSYQQPSIFRISIRLSFFIALSIQSIMPTTRHTADKHGIVWHLLCTHSPEVRNENTHITHTHTQYTLSLFLSSPLPLPLHSHWICLYIRMVCVCLYIDVLLRCRY